MHLVLNEDEKIADNWLQWDDEAIGKMVRSCGILMCGESPNSTLWAQAAALILCTLAGKVNSKHTVLIENGVKSADKNLGNFKITIQHSDEAFVTPDACDGEKLISVGFSLNREELNSKSELK